MTRFRHFVRTAAFLAGIALVVVSPARAQTVESVGTRALGMGGAFVAVADDSSATWWNPAGLAAGPFLDVGIAGNAHAIDGTLPASGTGAWSFALATPPFGVSVYRMRLTDARALDPTGQDHADRETRRAGVAVRSLSVTQFGATVLHSLLDGVHVGATVKYVRGTPRHSVIPGAEAVRLDIPDLLDAGADLDGGDAEQTVDLDVGALAVLGAFRVGGVVRNVREPLLDGMRLPRQVRVGAAFDGGAEDVLPVIVAVDADLRAYDVGAGERRMFAVGAEHWIRPQRLSIRGGARFNTAGAHDRTVTAGASVAPRAGMYLDTYVAYGGDTGDGGWGIAARVSF